MIAISFLALFLEMAQIRFTNSTVQLIAYFNNFVILSAFLGLGLGVLLARRWTLPLRWFPLLWLVMVGSSVWLDAYAGYKYTSTVMMAWVKAQAAIALPPWLVVSWVFFGTLAMFVPIGARLGQAIDGFENRLEAYGWDLLGSLLGVLAFALVSWLQLPPLVWFVVAAALVAALLPPSRTWVKALTLAALIATVALTQTLGAGMWSPYYKVTTDNYYARDADGTTTSIGYAVVVDHLRIQDGLDLSSSALKATSFAPWIEYYDLAHKLRSPSGKVLVLGGGSGNDAAAALLAGASAVTVAEIDPVLVKLGHTRHPLKPYIDPRVTVANTDARAFLRDGEGTFDLIVMNALDSHLELPGLSTLRLESFVYTVDAFKAVKRRMGPETLFVLQHASVRGWQAQRLYASLVEAFGQEPVLLTTPKSPFGSVALVYGPDALIAKLKTTLPPGISRVDPEPYRAKHGTIDLATDNWPHLYLIKRGVPELYKLVIVLVVVVTALAFMILGRIRVERTGPHFFLLGAAFMLMEASALTRFALLLGATWVVNAVVVAAVLAVISIGNALLWRGWRPPEALMYGGLAASLLLVYAIPLEPLLTVPWVARVLLAGLWIGTPIFFASLVFSSSFREARDPTTALGANLLGVVVGGTLEYLSMAYGMQVLILVALGLYGLAWGSGRLGRPSPRSA